MTFNLDNNGTAMLTNAQRKKKRQPWPDVIAISIVNENVEVCRLLANWMGQTHGVRCAGTFTNGESALETLPGGNPQVVLIDIKLPGISGIETLRKLRLLLPRTHFLIFTNSQDADHVFEALAAGAAGYFLVDSPMTTLFESIRRIYSGYYPTKVDVARKVLSTFQYLAAKPNSDLFSRRQIDVLELLVQGCQTKEIARLLKVGTRSVNTHIRRIFIKFGVHSRAQAVAKYTQPGY